MIGDDHSVDADVGGAPSVLGVEHALDHQAAIPVLADPGDVVPGDARVELRIYPFPERGGGARVGDGVLQVAQ